MAGAQAGWIREFDHLRGFAILAIVVIHAGAYYLTVAEPDLLVTTVQYLTHLSDFGVPVFFFVSGYVLSLRYFDVTDLRTFYRRRLTFIIFPYLAFSAVYVVFNLYTIPDYTVQEAAWSVVLFNATGVFWFIAVLLQLYLLFPLLTRWQRSSEARGRGWEMVAVSVLLMVGYYALYGTVAQAITGIYQPVEDFGGIIATRLFPGYLVYFALGIWAQRNTASWERSMTVLGSVPGAVAVVAVAGVLSLLQPGLLWGVLVLPYSVIALGVLYRVSRWLVERRNLASRTTAAMGVYSYGIYLAHMLVIAVIVNRLWAAGIFADQGLFYILLVPGTVALSMVGLFLLNLLPFGQYITGVRARSRAPREERRAIRSRNGRV